MDRRYMKALLAVILTCFLSIVPQIASALSEKETYSGYYIDRIISGNNVLLVDEKANKQIKEITDKLARAAGINEQLTVRILNLPNINAYASPAGFIYLTTGLLDLVESKDELAAIIAHEVAHVAESHYMNAWAVRDRNRAVAEVVIGVVVASAGVAGGVLAGQAAASSFKSASAGVAVGSAAAIAASSVAAFAAGFGVGIAVFGINGVMMSGYSQQHELDADIAGAKFSKSAGFNPRGMISFLKKMEFVQSKQKSIKNLQYASKFISAEPGISERIKQLNKSLDKI